MERVILAELGAILVVRPQNSTPSHASCERPGSALSPDADQAAVTTAARFGSDQVSFSKKFLRIPILPHSVSLYATELKRLMLNGELRNTLRLSLLSCLATAAALEFKITGSDKGIW